MSKKVPAVERQKDGTLVVVGEASFDSEGRIEYFVGRKGKDFENPKILGSEISEYLLVGNPYVFKEK